MNLVFLDTSGLIAVVNADDQWHATAEAAWKELVAADRPLITTSLVLIELGDGLARIRHRRLAIQIHDRLRTSARVEVVQTTQDHEERAWQLFRKTSDKEWGMTDCVSIITMQEHRVLDAPTMRYAEA